MKEIVIKLEDDAYDFICSKGYHTQSLYNAIKNGIVLPEYHGDLIDRDVFALDEYLERRYGADFYWEFRRRLDKQNAIIKATKIL